MKNIWAKSKVFYLGGACSLAFLLILFINCVPSTKKANHRFTADDVLLNLDSAFFSLHKTYGYQDALKDMNSPRTTIHYTFFPDLEHGYFITAGSHINLYADSTRWAIVFEKSGYQNRGSDAEIELDYFGNCVSPVVEKYNGITYFSNMAMVELIAGEEYERIRNKADTGFDSFEFISQDAQYVMVRDKKVPIEHDSLKYTKLGIRSGGADNPKHLIGYGDLVRYLNDTDPVLLKASEKEIRKYLPADLPKLMTIDKFHFESVYNKLNQPDKNETWVLVSKILEKRDTSLWKPKLKANNHWSNWESGNL